MAIPPSYARGPVESIGAWMLISNTLISLLIGSVAGYMWGVRYRQQDDLRIQEILSRPVDVHVSISGMAGTSGGPPQPPSSGPGPGSKLVDFLAGEAGAAIRETRKKVGDTADLPSLAAKAFIEKLSGKSGEHLAEGFNDLIRAGITAIFGKDDPKSDKRDILTLFVREIVVRDRDMLRSMAPRMTERALFEHDKAVLTRSGYEVVERVRSFAKTYPETVILLSGHADTTGLPPHNGRLAHRRSIAVRESLISAGGVAPSRVFTADLTGMSLPVLTGPNAKEPHNRSVDIEVR